jgi:hypothetical protein
MKKLRLLLFSDCNRNCEGCCNKDWDLDNLPEAISYEDYDTIMLTGGEPMLHPDIILNTVGDIRIENPLAKIILYTAQAEGLIKLISILDGVTLTIHEPEDYEALYELDSMVRFNTEFSPRLNIFKEAGPIPEPLQNNWIIQPDMIWVENCPLPKGEVFMKLRR